jgi:hypothetical protein
MGLQKEPSKWALISFRNRYTPPSKSTFEASWKIANENSSKKNKMDLVKSNSQVVPIQGGFLTLLITSSFSGVYVLCVCACLRACMCGVFVCVCVCVSHPPLSKVCSRLLCAPTPLFLLPFTFPALLSPSPELLLCLSSLSSLVCVLCVILSCLNLTPPRLKLPSCSLTCHIHIFA